jgi:FixJ family two-component response regulator
VEKHRHNILEKMHAHSLADLVRMIVQLPAENRLT